MIPILFASVVHVVFGVLMAVTAVFLMLIVLVQRGRGGGLAGAFGGAGGQSAFGTKAGDLFTRITICVAAFWIVLCLVALRVLGTTTSRFGTAKPAPAAEGLINPGGEGGGETTGETGAVPTEGLGSGSGKSTGEDAGAGAPESSGAVPTDSKKD